MDWFRFYTEAVKDRKLRRLPAEQRWLWIAVLCCASDSPQRGSLLLAEGAAVTIDDLSDIAAIPRDAVERGVAAFQQLDMLYLDENHVYIVTNWHKRQFSSDGSTERVRAHRERSRNVSPLLQGSFGNVSETPQKTEADTEAEYDPLLVINGEDSPNGSSREGAASAKDDTPQLAQAVAHAAHLTAYDPEALQTLITRFRAHGRPWLLDEATAAAAWIANPEKNKLHRRMNLDFLRNWYKKAAEGYRHEGQHDSPTPPTGQRRNTKRSATARPSGQRGSAPEPGSHEYWAQVRADQARQKTSSATDGRTDDRSTSA